MSKIKYPRIKFSRNSKGKLTDSVLVLVQLNKKDETLDWYSLKDLRKIFKNQLKEEKTDKSVSATGRIRPSANNPWKKKE